MTELLVTADGRLHCAGKVYDCLLGRAGIVADKREGDGGTPVGRYPLRRVFFRSDRLAAPDTALPVQATAPDDGWCDDPAHADYNRLVRLPHPASCETLWRDDHVYDLVVVLGHNDDPPVPGRGSAIFMHLMRPDRQPTAGCVALSRADLLEILGQCDESSAVVITDCE